MTINTTLAKIINMVDALNNIADMDVPYKTSYKLMQVMDAVEEHRERYQKLHRELVQKHGEEQLDEDGNDTGNIQVKPDNVESFRREQNELLETEVELNVPRFQHEDFEGTEVKPRWLIQIKDILPSPEEDN